MYFFDTAAPENHCVVEEYTNNATKQAIINYYILTTISNNKEFYTQKEIQGAKKARNTQQIIVCPSTVDFKNYIKENLLLHHCNITIDYNNGSEAICGTPLVPCQETTVTSTPSYLPWYEGGTEYSMPR